MADTDPKDRSSLDSLLAKMPQIAEAVSKFPENVQQQAFDALMAAATGGSSSPHRKEPSSRDPGASSSRTGSARKRNANGEAEPPKRRRRAGTPTELRDLDLAPKGKKSFKDFVEEKQPRAQDDMNAVSVYYLIEVLKVGPVTFNHVYTCYREVKMRTPTNLPNSLALTASRKGYLDTAETDNIAMTPRGRNYVEYDLPPKKEKAK